MPDSFEVHDVLAYLEQRWQIQVPSFEVSFENSASVNKIAALVSDRIAETQS